MLEPQELDRLLERGEAQLARVAAALEAAWQRHDTADTQREAHKLAGLAGSLGCSTVLAVARDVEAAGADTKRIEVLLDQLRHLLPKALDELRDWRVPLTAARSAGPRGG